MKNIAPTMTGGQTMKRIATALLIFGIGLFAFLTRASAQVFIVASCGTVPASQATLTAGKSGMFFIDTNGNLCTGATFTPSGTQNVNLTQILGAAPSLTNPLWVFPATGATFPVSGTFWPYTLGQQLAAASVPVVLTAAQLSTLTPPATVAATQSGTWTVQPGNTANTTAWLVGLNATPSLANGNGVVPAPSSESAAGLTPVPSTSLEANHVIKASPGNLYSFNVSADSTLSGAAWWLMIYNATTAPADGAVTPVKCYAFPSGTTGYSAAFNLPIYLSTGITLGVSTTGCFTKTASAHAFISGDAK